MLELFYILDGVLYNVIGLFFVVLGILVLIRHTGFPDLTVDGSFTFGAAIFASTISHNNSLSLSLFLAVVFGCIAGGATALINQWLGVTKIVASVVSMTVFILLSPYIADGATIGLLEVDPLLEALRKLDTDLSRQLGIIGYSLHVWQVAFWSILLAILTAGIYSFMRSSLGTQLRYIGSAKNPSIVVKEAIPRFTLLGLLIGNACVALGGSIEAVRRGAFTANMGLGTLLVALTVLILGESILKIYLKRDYLHLNEQFISIFIGLFVYSCLLQFILRLGIDFLDLKLMTTVMLLGVLVFAGRFFPNSGRLF